MLEEQGMLGNWRKIEARMAKVGDPSVASISVFGGWAGGTQMLWWNLPGKVTAHGNYRFARLASFESHVVPSHHLFPPLSDRFEVAEQWLHGCVANHSCSGEDEPRWPTRLLEVGDNAIRVIRTAELKALPQYATLSYCWGNDDFLKLLNSNAAKLSDRTSLHHVPTTFRDAVWLTRRLGLRYIWTDTLCIIQECDDDRDWRRESGIMRSTYGGSHINIAAASAANAHNTMFSKAANYRGGLTAQVTTYSGNEVRSFHSSDVYERSVRDVHLASRAWTLQERLLAPRTIYFGDTGMFWGCRSGIASECLPSGFPGKLGSQLLLPRHQPWDWKEIVRHYSNANLSKESDKLPALSGIARRQQELTGDKYLVGMWRKRLEKQLGWESASNCQTVARPAWRAPTWSGASTDATVYHWSWCDDDRYTENEYVEVLQVGTMPAGPDPFGAVISAHLRLACTALMKAECRTAVRGNSREISVDRVVDPTSFAVDSSDDLLSDVGEVIYLLPLFGGHSGTKTKLAGSQHGGEASMVLSTDASYQKDADQGGDQADAGQDIDDDADDESSEGHWVDELMVRGMVLPPVDLFKGRFERIGSFDFRSMEDPFANPGESLAQSPPNYHPFMQAMHDVGATTAEAMCIGTRGDTASPRAKYIIDII